jgi:hypothetical protein
VLSGQEKSIFSSEVKFLNAPLKKNAKFYGKKIFLSYFSFLFNSGFFL